MSPLALKFADLPQRVTRRSPAPVREAAPAPRQGASLLDPVREPAGLQYPMSVRARRLMRTGRVNGW
jgi:hypothetical protein